MMNDDTDKAVDALLAVRLIHRTYASSGNAAKRVQDVAEMLAMCDNGMGMNGGICRNVAEAILKAFGGDVSRVANPNKLREEASSGT